MHLQCITMQIINFKIQESIVKEIDKSLKMFNFNNRTEFIRNAIRNQLEDYKMKQAMASIAHLRGASKSKITDEEYEEMRRIGFEKILKKI